MKWSLSKPEDVIASDGSVGASVDQIEEYVKNNIMFAKLEDMVAWGRGNSLWPFNFVCPAAMLKWRQRSPVVMI